MKKRIISAVIALLITCPLVYLGGIPFYILCVILALIGYREFIKLFTKTISIRIIGYLSLLAIIISNLNKYNFSLLIDSKILVLIFLVFAIAALVHYKQDDFDIKKCFYLFGVTIFIAISFSIIIIIRNMSLPYFIYLFLITILTDTFAQTTGMLFGKHKINEISPNKTWEGCLGGSFFGTLFASLFYIIIVNGGASIFVLILVTLLLTIIGQIGDLFFSLIKRNYKIKDFSNLMPGHGGILDRFDSIIFVCFAFVYFITFL